MGDGMGYRIEYQRDQKGTFRIKNYTRIPVLTILCFFLFLFLVNAFWPDGAALLQKTRLYSKGIIALSALNDLANELHYGEPLVTAFSDFCGKLMP